MGVSCVCVCTFASVSDCFSVGFFLQLITLLMLNIIFKYKAW